MGGWSLLRLPPLFVAISPGQKDKPLRLGPSPGNRFEGLNMEVDHRGLSQKESLVVGFYDWRLGEKGRLY